MTGLTFLDLAGCFNFTDEGLKDLRHMSLQLSSRPSTSEAQDASRTRA